MTSFHRIAVASVLALLAACRIDVDADDGTFACKNNNDCLNDYRCVMPANATSDSVGVCATGDGNAACTKHDDCPGDQVCKDGACRNVCLLDRPCAEDVCIPNHTVAQGYDCRACNLNAFDCGEPDKACVQAASGTSSCRRKCSSNSECAGAVEALCVDALVLPGTTTSTRVCSFPCGCLSSTTCKERGRLGGGANIINQAVYCDRGGEAVCNDGLDGTDGDSAIDCEDAECFAAGNCL